MPAHRQRLARGPGRCGGANRREAQYIREQRAPIGGVPFVLLDPRTQEATRTALQARQAMGVEERMKFVFTAAERFDRLFNNPERRRIEESIRAVAEGGGVS